MRAPEQTVADVPPPLARAAAFFNTDRFLSGLLHLPPGCIKDSEDVGVCHQEFSITQAQGGAIDATCVSSATELAKAFIRVNT